jgi:hypothetical protein
MYISSNSQPSLLFGKGSPKSPAKSLKRKTPEKDEIESTSSQPARTMSSPQPRLSPSKDTKRRKLQQEIGSLRQSLQHKEGEISGLESNPKMPPKTTTNSPSTLQLPVLEARVDSSQSLPTPFHHHKTTLPSINVLPQATIPHYHPKPERTTPERELGRIHAEIALENLARQHQNRPDIQQRIQDTLAISRETSRRERAHKANKYGFHAAN